jgi:hypothetical protein
MAEVPLRTCEINLRRPARRGRDRNHKWRLSFFANRLEKPPEMNAEISAGRVPQPRIVAKAGVFGFRPLGCGGIEESAQNVVREPNRRARPCHLWCAALRTTEEKQ